MARRTNCADSSIARTPSASASSSTSSTTTSGPDGNYLNDFSPDYFTDKYTNDWGRAINFEGPRQVRDFFVENAGYWIDEFHFDGLRLDATQDVRDASPEHVIAAIVRAARAAAGTRTVLVVAENEPQQTSSRAAAGRRAATAWTRSGTTTTITPRSSH